MGCFSNNPDTLREKTAQATSTLKQDAKAVAQGVHEGWTRDHPLDLNHATHEQLLSLPGMSTQAANRVIATRPFTTTHQLVSRQILSQSDYDRVKERLTVKP
jgi:DNA uptake protein ComE-like DNA-binding protein